MYVDNRVQFGRLTNPTTFGLVHLHNDLWQLFDNPVVSIYFANRQLLLQKEVNSVRDAKMYLSTQNEKDPFVFGSFKIFT